MIQGLIKDVLKRIHMMVSRGKTLRYKKAYFILNSLA